jgi:hypothetical protein
MGGLLEFLKLTFTPNKTSVFHKWPLEAIWKDKNPLLLAFIIILKQNTTFI